MGRPGFVWAARAVVFLVGGVVVSAGAGVEAAYRPAVQIAGEARLDQPRLASAPAAAPSQRSGKRRFRRDANGELIPDVRAAAAVIYNPVTQEIIYAENADDQRSIASITKVMTALIVLASEPDLSRRIDVAPSDVHAASHTYLRARERLSVNELLHLMLIGSDNAAARAIARESVLGYSGFIDAMNAKATALGLSSTHYADPSGLDPANVSSAYDMARLISFAVGSERIAEVMRTPEYRLRINKRRVKLKNTNKLLGGDVDVQGGKTGFIRKAGYCLAALLKLPTGDPVAVVVLGARSNAGRFVEARHLLNWLNERGAPVLTTATSTQP
ncbi:MAG: peptidase S11 [Luteitalea sp.]|nr:peptidase S11 [Luteitalea sp.]